MHTVLVIGATGNIGTSAVIAALRSRCGVLAIVRNQASAEKLFANVGTREGITTVEADIMSDKGVKSVVSKVRSGELPAFQHVYSAGKCSSSGCSMNGTDLLRSWRYLRGDFHP